MINSWTTEGLGARSINLDRRRIPVRSSDRKPGPHPYYGASGVVDHVDGFLFDGLHLLVAEDGENLRSRSTPVAFLADGKFWVNNHAHILTANDANDTRYLSYALEAVDISGYITGSAQPKLTQAALASIPVHAPGRDEQRRIAATLGALDDKIESNRRAQALIEQFVQARFNAAFSVDDAPDGEPISSLVTVNSRRTLGQGQLATYVGMSFLPEHAAEVMDWDVKEFGSGQKFVNGDVLMARITPCLENGKTAVVDMLHGDEVGWGSTEYIVLTPRGDVSTPWIYCLVRSELVRAYAIRSMTGTSGRQRFQPDGFDKYRVSAPERRALQAFNAEAMPLFARMTALRDENRALAKVRDALLPELLSGRVRVPEAAKAAEGLA